MKNTIKAYFNKYEKFTESEINILFEKLEYKTYSKKEFLLKQGSVCNYKYFILEGLVRSYHLNKDGVEQINLFAIENWWLTDFSSFVNNEPSHNSIQAIEKTKVLYISKDDLEFLYKEIPKLERVFRIITEKYAVALQKKYEVFMKRSSKDRYDFLVQNIPNFANRVPLYMIASYLDITPEYLSAIRKHV